MLSADTEEISAKTFDPELDSNVLLDDESEPCSFEASKSTNGFEEYPLTSRLDSIRPGTSLAESLSASLPHHGLGCGDFLLKIREQNQKALLQRKTNLRPPARVIPKYEASNSTEALSQRLKICIVTRDIIGVIRNGGIGTANAGLAEALVRAGHQVTVLFMGGVVEDKTIRHWIDYYRAKGIELALPSVPPLALSGPDYAVRSYQAAEWLRHRDFKVIYFHDWGGVSYFSTLLKKQRLAFQNTALGIVLHAPSRWVDEFSEYPVQSFDQIHLDRFEGESVARADLVLGTCQYMLNWVQAQGWRLPERCYWLPNILPGDCARLPKRSLSPGEKVEEIIFYGRLETRKGLELFCRAIDSLQDRHREPFSVTFLGKEGSIHRVPAVRYIRTWASKWHCKVRVLPHHTYEQAISYLTQPGRIAVSSSLADNSPLAIQECLTLGIPILASRVGGIPELIADADRDRVLFELNSQDLSQRLGSALDHGLAPAALAVSPEAAERSWCSLFEELAALQDRPQTLSDAASEPPLVSVCIAYSGKTRSLAQLLSSLEKQDHKNLDVIVISCTHKGNNAQPIPADLSKRFSRLCLRTYQQRSACISAALNHAASLARGEYLALVADHIALKPHAISTLVRAGIHAKTDLLTCAYDVVEQGDLLSPNKAAERHLPPGHSLAVDILDEPDEHSFLFVKRSSFISHGGFAEDTKSSFLDPSFITRLELHGGCCELVPESLFLKQAGVSVSLSRKEKWEIHEQARLSHAGIWPDSLRAICRWDNPNIVSRDIAAAFYSANTSLYRADAAVGFAGIVSCYDALVLEDEKGLRISSQKGDPQLLLPKIEVPSEGELFICVEIIAPETTHLEIFYLCKGISNFQQQLTAHANLFQGRNRVYLRICHSALNGFLRLDPGQIAGEYKLLSLEIRGFVPDDNTLEQE